MQAELRKVLVHIAQKCIANNWFRRGNEFHEFTEEDIKEFNAIAPGWDYIEDGYTFLDEDGVPEGMIRIYLRAGAGRSASLPKQYFKLTLAPYTNKRLGVKPKHTRSRRHTVPQTPT